MRLKGGGFFGMGDNSKTSRSELKGGNETRPLDAGLVKPYDQGKGMKGMALRTTSYSVLDEQELTEPGVSKVYDEELAQHPEMKRSDSERFHLEAMEQAAQAQQGEQAQDRVTAALEEIEGKNKKHKKLSIILVSSEVARFAKSGGLADVADKLALALAKRGHRVMTVMPMYGYYEGAVQTGIKRDFYLWGGTHNVEYWHKWEPCGVDDEGNATGVDRVFVDHPCYHRPGMYGEWGMDYGDNLFRFALFSWASLEAALCVPAICPFGEDVTFIANDWQSGLVPLILASNYRRWRVFNQARSIFVVHNMGYHGVYPNPPTWDSPKFSFTDLGLRDNAYYECYQWTFPIDERPSKGRDPRDTGEAIKLLRGGIEMADRVVTVAPSYKDEIMSFEGGWGMHDTPRGRSYHLDGILNGIDVEEWNPATDPHIVHTYSAENMTNKTACKQALQFQLGLDQKPNTPLVAFIGRLAPQKGVDLIEETLGWLLGGDHMGVTGDVQLVMMGSGEGRYVEFLQRAEAQNKGRVVGYVGFTPEMEHKIMAGADILIMPSRYEPCGLPQMYAQRYGTVPVVHATGGLKDSVVQYNPFANETNKEDGGTGWQFNSADAEGIKFGLWNALHTYKHFPESWQGLMKRCMKKDFSWELSAKKYEQVIDWARMDPPHINPWPFQ